MVVKPIDFLWLKKKICTILNSEKGEPFLLMEDEFSLMGNALNVDKTMGSFLFFQENFSGRGASLKFGGGQEHPQVLKLISLDRPLPEESIAPGTKNLRHPPSAHATK